MKVVAFHGSPRRGGNTELLLDSALEPVNSGGHRVILFRLNEMNIKPCQNCGGCEETGECVIKDDMVEVYSVIREADRFILASPVFFFALSAQTKIMIDRCQAFWCEKYLLKKIIPEGKYGRKGLLLLAGGMEKEIGMQCCGATAKAFFRTISVHEHKVLSLLGVDEKGAVLKHPGALSDAYKAGEELIAGNI